MDLSQCEWDDLKNKRLKKARGVSFEEILTARLVDVERHPSKALQERMLFEWKGYIWVVPFVWREKGIFLKTIFASRKHTRRYLGGGHDETNR